MSGSQSRSTASHPPAGQVGHRRLDQLGYTFALINILPCGRQEEWQDSPSFVADPERRRILHEDGNEAHRLRVEHDPTRLYVELSGEDGAGPWTVLAVDRASRLYAVAQAPTKVVATQLAADLLTERLGH